MSALTGAVIRTEGLTKRFRSGQVAVDGIDLAGVVAEHRCNEPLCVRVDPDHLIPSTQAANLNYAVACGRTGIIRTSLRRQDRHARSLAVRNAVSGGWDPIAYSAASGTTAPLDTPSLF